MKAAIIDFKRTLWDPDNSNLFPGAEELLQSLQKEKIKLALVTAASNRKKREILIKPIASFFNVIKIVNEKSPPEFQDILKTFQVKPSETIVIGDKITHEIAIGNLLGMTTIRLKSGKYTEEEPQNENEKPTYSFSNLEQIRIFLNNKLL